MSEMKFSKKPGAKEKRYEHIIDAAEQVLIEQGYENATFNDFAEKANYNKRTLYLYFPDKDDLFAAVIMRVLKKLSEHVEDSIDTTKNGLETIIDITKAYFSFFFINKAYYKLLWSYEDKYFLFSENKHESTNINKTYHIRKKNIELISDTYTRGIKDNSITVKQDPNLVITLLWSQTLGVLQLITRGETMLMKDYKIDAETLIKEQIKLVKAKLTE
jgi:TetR/AcrR family transcriptional regulator